MIPKDHEEAVGFWEWVRTLLLLMIPVVGLFLWIYWACSSEGKASRRNLMRAQFFLTAVAMLLVGALFALRPGALSAYFRGVADAVDAAPTAFQQDEQKSGAGERGQDAAPAAPPTPKPPTVPEGEPLRTFRSTDGRAMEARVISLTDETVTVQRADGREFTSDMTRFSPEDVAYFMRLRNGGGAFD